MSVSPSDLHQPPTSSEEILASLFRPMGVDGVYIRTGAYEDVVDALGVFIGGLRPERAEVFRFPPVVGRALIRALERLRDAIENDAALQPLAAFAADGRADALYKAAQRGKLRVVRRKGRLLTTETWVADYRTNRNAP